LDLLRNESDYVFSDRYPERNEVYRVFDERSAEARRTLQCRLDLPYGLHPRERFDLFSRSGGPLVIFIHGGYWRSLSKERFSFVAAPLVRMGFTVALPGYPLAPDVTLQSVFDSVKRSVPAIFAATGKRPWIVAGHSAGGHLAAMLAAMDWGAEGIEQPACLPISGIFALKPLIDTSLNRDLGIDETLAAEMSPLRTPPPHGQVRLVVGADETPGFLKQSADYLTHCRGAGCDAELVQLSGRNHYTIVGELLEESSAVAQQFALLARGLDREERAGERP
jgi:arylformamidase